MSYLAPTPFQLGVNYPWLHYGHDFGAAHSVHSGVSLPESSARVAEDFAQIQQCGASVVRWFLFGDGRGGFLAEQAIPRRPDAFLFQDIAAVLGLAAKHNLKVCFSLLDYLWLQEHSGKRAPHSHEHVLHSAAGRTAFVENILNPIFREFREHPALFAWEIANEPEWAIREFHRVPEATLHLADFRVFASEIVSAVREHAAAPVTLGSARLLWLRAWSELGLDFYQAHYYPSAEREVSGGLAEQLAGAATLDKPLWLGEIPAHDPSTPAYTLEGALTACRAAGLRGAAVWRWTKPESGGSDAPLGCVEPAALRAWHSGSPTPVVNV